MSFFNANEVDIKPDFEALPAGVYSVMVESCEPKRTKDGQGIYISTCLQVVNDNFSGRKIFCNFNIQNASQQAQEIGRSDFAKFLIAVNVPNLESHSDCIKVQGKMFNATISQRKDKMTGGMANHVKKFDAPGSNMPSSDGMNNQQHNQQMNQQMNANAMQNPQAQQQLPPQGRGGLDDLPF